jgi:hypothetical protein
MRGWWAVLLGRAATPLGPVPVGARPILGALALLLRLYVVGVSGFLLGALGRADLPVLRVTGFLAYGYDKLLGGNTQFGLGPEFFRAVGLPWPEGTAVLVGLVEFLGGLALLVGLLTRVAALALSRHDGRRPGHGQQLAGRAAPAGGVPAPGLVRGRPDVD